MQVGIGVAVVVFGLVFTLGDFVPSGRYACKFKVWTRKYDWSIADRFQTLHGEVGTI